MDEVQAQEETLGLEMVEVVPLLPVDTKLKNMWNKSVLLFSNEEAQDEEPKNLVVLSK